MILVTLYASNSSINTQFDPKSAKQADVFSSAFRQKLVWLFAPTVFAVYAVYATPARQHGAPGARAVRVTQSPPTHGVWATFASAARLGHLCPAQVLDFCSGAGMVAPQRAGAVDTASSNSSDDTVAFRRWSRCIFQSQAGDPVDRAALLLMGGSAEWREESCTRWDETACACAAPLSLLGPAHTFVEVGAHDGLHMAATHFFENYLGWRGLCVEAGPAFYAQLAHTRPGCTRVNAVVGRPQDWGNRSTVPFISFSRKEGHAELGRKDWELGLSGPEGSSERTRTLASAESWARHVSKYRKPALFASRAWLPVRPFASIFAAHRVTRVDLLVVEQ